MRGGTAPHLGSACRGRSGGSTVGLQNILTWLCALILACAVAHNADDPSSSVCGLGEVIASAHSPVFGTMADSSGYANAFTSESSIGLLAIRACCQSGLRPAGGGAANSCAGNDDSWRAVGCGKVLGAGVEVEERRGNVPPAGLRASPDVPRPCSATSGRASCAAHGGGDECRVSPHRHLGDLWHGVCGPAHGACHCDRCFTYRVWADAILRFSGNGGVGLTISLRHESCEPLARNCRFAERCSSHGDCTSDCSEADSSLQRCSAVQTRPERSSSRRRKNDEEEEDEEQENGIWQQGRPNADWAGMNNNHGRCYWTKYHRLGIGSDRFPAVFWCNAIEAGEPASCNVRKIVGASCLHLTFAKSCDTYGRCRAYYSHAYSSWGNTVACESALMDSQRYFGTM